MTSTLPTSALSVPVTFNCARYITSPNAVRTADRVALTMIDGSDVRDWRWRDIWQRMASWQRIFKRYALEPRDRIVLCVPNSPDIPCAMLAAIAQGFVPVVLSPQLSAEEVDSITGHCGALLRIDDSGPVSHGRSSSAFEGGGAAILSLSQAKKMLKAAHDPDERPHYIDSFAEDSAYMVYTSGTTGSPRGVLHAHRAVWARRMMIDGWTGIRSDDTILHSGQLNWTYAMGIAVFDAWAQGARSIIYEGPRNTELWARLLREHRATIFAAVPSLYRQLCRDVGSLEEDTQSLRHGLCAGEPLPIPLWETWRERTQKPLYEALGMSECSTYISSGPNTPTLPGSPGKAQAGRRIGILDLDQKTPTLLPANQVGMLAIHASDPGLMLGYFNAEDATQNAYLGDWFLTGDLAAFDDAGYLHYHGRNDDTIISLGYRVGPAEVEAVLIQHPQIREVAVNGHSPREDLTLVCAHVVLQDGAEWSEALESSVRDFLQNRLAAYKQPRLYAVHEQLPRNRSGKVLRRQLHYRAEGA